MLPRRNFNILLSLLFRTIYLWLPNNYQNYTIAIFKLTLFYILKVPLHWCFKKCIGCLFKNRRPDKQILKRTQCWFGCFKLGNWSNPLLFDRRCVIQQIVSNQYLNPCPCKFNFWVWDMFKMTELLQLCATMMSWVWQLVELVVY